MTKKKWLETKKCGENQSTQQQDLKPATFVMLRQKGVIEKSANKICTLLTQIQSSLVLYIQYCAKRFHTKSGLISHIQVHQRPLVIKRRL